MESTERRFVEVLAERIASLPFDLKICFALLADEDQPEELHRLAAGVAVYVLGPNDIIPDHILPVGFADDAIILWAMLDELRRGFPEAAQKISDRFDVPLDRIEETAAVFHGYLGDLHDWLAGKLPDLHRQVYKGKTAAHYAADAEAGQFLYDEAQSFVTDFDLNREYLARHLTGPKVRDALQSRAETERMRR